jgi:hypothetical protein
MATKQSSLILRKHLSHCRTDSEHFLVSSGKVTMLRWVRAAVIRVSPLLIDAETSGASGEGWFESACTVAITKFASN